jgi:hypothetical protein
VQDVDEERTTAATTSLTTVGTTAATTSLMAAGTTAPRHGDIDDRYRGSASTDDDVLSTVAVRIRRYIGLHHDLASAFTSS